MPADWPWTVTSVHLQGSLKNINKNTEKQIKYFYYCFLPAVYMKKAHLLSAKATIELQSFRILMSGTFIYNWDTVIKFRIESAWIGLSVLD